MKYEDLSWFNQQLAAMLREGLPVSGALRELTSTMNRGDLRTQFEAVHSRLEQGESLDRAVLQTNLPPLYKAMVAAGVKSGDMPGALGFTADYYSDAAKLVSRTKALLFYPILVLIVGFGLCVLIWRIAGSLGRVFELNLQDSMLVLPVLLAGIFLLIAIGMAMPSVRDWMLGKIPGFREARASQISRGLAMLLRHGVPLQEAVRLIRELEGKSPAGKDLALWEQQMAAGSSDFTSGAERWRGLPVLLASFLRSSKSNLVQGFERASVYFKERSQNQTSMLLHAGAPILVLLLGFFVSSQLSVFVKAFVDLVGRLGAE